MDVGDFVRFLQVGVQGKTGFVMGFGLRVSAQPLVGDGHKPLDAGL